MVASNPDSTPSPSTGAPLGRPIVTAAGTEVGTTEPAASDGAHVVGDRPRPTRQSRPSRQWRQARRSRRRRLVLPTGAFSPELLTTEPPDPNEQEGAILMSADEFAAALVAANPSWTAITSARRATTARSTSSSPGPDARHRSTSSRPPRRPGRRSSASRSSTRHDPADAVGSRPGSGRRRSPAAARRSRSAPRHAMRWRRAPASSPPTPRRREPVYGVSTGFGSLATTVIPPERRDELQRALIRSHAAGMGRAVEDEVVRAMMLLRARSLALGYSGVRPVVVERIVELLNAGITPAVPEHGSLGASGDLAPLAHVALALMGEGDSASDSRGGGDRTARAAGKGGPRPDQRHRRHARHAGARPRRSRRAAAHC